MYLFLYRNVSKKSPSFGYVVNKYSTGLLIAAGIDVATPRLVRSFVFGYHMLLFLSLLEIELSMRISCIVASENSITLLFKKQLNAVPSYSIDSSFDWP